MKYSINIKNTETGEEEVISGNNVNDVLQRVSDNIISIKKNVKMIYGDQSFIRQMEGTELRKLELGTKKENAQKATDEMKLRIQKRNRILLESLDIKIDVWNYLHNKLDKTFDVPQPIEKELPNPPILQKIPPKPSILSEKYLVKKNLFDYLFKKNFLKKIKEADVLYERELKNWKVLIDKIELENTRKEDNYRKIFNEITIENQKNFEIWFKDKEQFESSLNYKRQQFIDLKQKYLGKDKNSIEYFYRVLLSAFHDDEDFFEKIIEVYFNPVNRILLVEYYLPCKEDITSVKEVKYITTKDFFEEKEMSKVEYQEYYDKIIYQITLRTIYEIFFHDDIYAIEAVAFNGYVNTIDIATGQNITPCILSVITSKNNFNQINLRQVDYRECFKSLKGVSASSFITQTPILPLIQFDKNDKRFISKKDVLNRMDEKLNLASMDWEEFEHLVREIFEKEFSTNGGEVKVTRASRDGGVDAVAFDPDPIRGGKIVIQAKRYTNTVGVSAVRDLYGTVMNEGATKGILVTTADYGPDAYEFARGKPLTLLNGSNLLHLLEKHGHKAKIDLKAAKQILSEKERQL